MIDRRFIVDAYRLLLGRMPESEAVILGKLNAPSEVALLIDMMASAEFETRSGFVPAPDRWVLAEHELGFRIWLNLADLGVCRPILMNRYESAGTAFISNHLRAGDRFVDIGANVGFYALLAARLVGPTGDVIAFEAHPDLTERAGRSATENGFTHCAIHNVALGAAPGTALLVYAPGSSNWGGAYLSFDGAVPPGHTGRPVAVAPLARFLEGKPPTLLKIDVEGAEHLVLSGAIDLIRATRPVILSELHVGQLQRVSGVSPATYIELLAGAGYRCHLLDPDGTPGRRLDGNDTPPLCDVVFMPEVTAG
jgi:FkbM family methyltransferase